jgi:NAD(P)-dependent dehydrogenase (short-subunit alcohol dehydrogenase family)
MRREVVIVTGAGGGIGSAVAARLGASGYAVGTLDLELERSRDVASGIVSAGGAAWAGALDTVDPGSVEHALDGVEQHLGPVTHLVAAAGIIRKAAFLDLDIEAWDHTLAVNLTGTWLVMQRAARRMVAGQRSGAFVAVSSVAGRGGRATAADYAASKAGVISVVRSAALALAPHGIRVNAVCPGVVDTPMTDAIHEQASRELGITRDESIARMVAGIPLGRIETVDDVASAVEYLLSDGAGYVTGQALNVCGGLELD